MVVSAVILCLVDQRRCLSVDHVLQALSYSTSSLSFCSPLGCSPKVKIIATTWSRRGGLLLIKRALLQGLSLIHHVAEKVFNRWKQSLTKLLHFRWRQDEWKSWLVHRNETEADQSNCSYTATSRQSLIEMFWPHFWGAVTSSIFTYSCQPTLIDTKESSFKWRSDCTLPTHDDRQS